MWRLVPGPEWEQSVRDADPDDGYFEDNLRTTRDVLAYDPFYLSRPFLGERDDARVFTTKDVAAGYRLVVFFKVRSGEQTVELGWVVLEQLEADT